MSDSDVLYSDSMPGREPGRYLLSTYRRDGTRGPDVVVTVEPGQPDRWEPLEAEA